MASNVEQLQRILQIRLDEYEALPASPNYSEGQTSEALDSLRSSLLREIEKLQALIASTGAAGGEPWEVTSTTVW